MEVTKEEKFILQDEALTRIINAVAKMYVLVGSTMGPNGGTIVIPDSTELGKYKITKDGVSVSKTVKSENKYEQVIINLLKDVASNTVKIAGDGTTTSIILTQYLLQRLLPIANRESFEAFDKCLNDTIEYLNESKQKVKSKDIYDVALVSANGDKKIAELIYDAYEASKVVHVERSTTRDEDFLETIKGIYIPSEKIVGYGKTASEVELKNVSVVVVNQHIKKLSFIEDVLKSNMNMGKDYSLLIIADHVDESIINIATLNNREGKTNVHFIKSPGFSTQRTKLLSDIAEYAGCKLVEDSTTKILKEHIGTITSANIKAKKSFIYNEDANVNKLIKSLEKEYNEAESEHEKDLLQQRIDRLKGLSIIKVGAKSEAEMNERFDRYEDAVLAVSCAIESGVVEGGGLALAKYAGKKLQELEYNPDVKVKNPEIYFYLALFGPLETIIQNGTELTIESDLLEEKIYDPAKVTITALEQAYSFVKLLLTTKGIILSENEFI